VTVAVVLAAGLGTRLRPLTDLLPKALCPVDNTPLVDLALEDVSPFTDDVAVNVHHHSAAMEAHLRGRTHLSIEPAPLGSAGALGKLRDWIGGRPALVANADAWRGAGLAPLLDGWDGARVRLLVTHDPTRPDFGQWRYAGASLMPWAAIAPLAAEPSSLYDRCWAPAWAEGSLDLVRFDGPFYDCGTPPDYLAANLAASGGRSVVGPGALVEGELVRSVVWPGGVVRAGERLVECVRAGEDVTVHARLPGARLG
jgi:MurNAc alpha-1-phosphate uridylyltransferase